MGGTLLKIVAYFHGPESIRVVRTAWEDRDSICGAYFRQQVKNMGIKEVLTAAWSPWQNPFVERLIGSIRRDCLDHVIVLNESHLKRILISYSQCYHYDRTNYELGKETPVEHPVQPRPVKGVKVIELPRVGGLHHQYEWKEATWTKVSLFTVWSPETSRFQLIPNIALNWFIPREVFRIASGKLKTRSASGRPYLIWWLKDAAIWHKWCGFNLCERQLKRWSCKLKTIVWYIFGTK